MYTYVGIDNGVTGSIGFINTDGKVYFCETPVKSEQNYTKKKGNITRVLTDSLYKVLKNNIVDISLCRLMIERPMVNPQRWAATMSAIRCLESTITIVELLKIPYEYIDSKQWQRALLPSGIKGHDLLKKASYDIGQRLFPQSSDMIIKHKDADGILIAEYCRRFYKNNENLFNQ